MIKRIHRITFTHLLLPTIVVLAALLSIASAARAQSETPSGETGSAPEEPAQLQAYTIAEISVEAEATATTIHSIEGQAIPDKALIAIREKIPAKLEDLERLLTRTKEWFQSPVSLRDYEDLRLTWKRAREQVEGWNHHLSQRAQALDGDIATLQTLRARWDLTRQAAVDADLTDALIAVIDGSIKAVEEALTPFGDRRAEVLATQGELQGLFDVITPGLSLMTEMQESESFGLFSQEAPPLWEVLYDSTTTANYAGQLREVLANSWKQVGDFVSESTGKLIFQAVLFVALVALLVYARRKLGRLNPDILHIETTTRILARPVSAALVVSLATMLILYRDFPQPVGTLAMLILFIPLFRILPGEMLRHRKGPFIALVILFLLNRFVDALPHLSMLQRTLLLAEALAAFFMLRYAFRKPSGEESADATQSSRVARGLASIGLVLLLAAVVLNAIGDVGLAGLLSNAVVIAGFMTVILIATYLGCRSLLWIGLNTPLARELNMVQRHDELLGRRTLTVVRVVLTLVWFSEILALLRIREPVLKGLWAFLTAEAKFGEIGISLADILSFVITIWAAVLISRFVRFALDEDIYWRLKLPRGVPHALSAGIHYAILLAAFFLATAAAGVELSKLTLLAGAFGVGIGFGLQNVVNNFISGIILLVERPILPGDTVQIGELTGAVKRIGMRSSTVRTWEGAEVIVPNGNLISNEVINWTLSDRVRRVHIDVGVAYGTDPTQVMDLLVATAKTNEQVLTTPAPHALFQGFGDSSLNFQLRVWTGYDRFLRTKSEVTVAVEKAIKEAGITIPFPQRDLHVKTVSDEARGALEDRRDDGAT